MNVPLVVGLLCLAHTAPAQIYCVRPLAHTPRHERIFFEKGSFMAAERVIGDLGPAPVFPDMVGIGQWFANMAGERTNHFYTSCLPEVPLARLRVQSPGNLISDPDAYALLNGAVVVPRNVWTNHAAHVGGRYVFSLIGPGDTRYVVDLRGSSTAVVFFPDGTYRCVMDANSSCATMPWRRVMDVTTNQPSTCEVHCLAMTNKTVELEYGMQRSASAREFKEARRKLFPHADEPYDTGFCIEPSEKHARVFVCGQCTEARRQWLASRRASKEAR